MWNTYKISRFILAAGLIIGFYSCTNLRTKNKDKPDNSIADSTAISLEDKVREFFLIPSPGEILERFYGSGIQYNPGLLNSAGNKDKYLGSKAQSLNLGVYIADMAYSALFERSTETVKYLEVIQSLSIETGISSSIFESLLVRSKANAGKMDSLLSISNEAFNNMKDFLETGGKQNMIARISAGAYIESLNIVIQSLNKYSESSKIPGLVADMKYPIDNLLEMAKGVTATENDTSLYKTLDQISDIFNEMEVNSSKTQISEKQAGKITISGGMKLSMNESEFNKLKSRVSEIRGGIVGY